MSAFSVKPLTSVKHNRRGIYREKTDFVTRYRNYAQTRNLKRRLIIYLFIYLFVVVYFLRGGADTVRKRTIVDITLTNYLNHSRKARETTKTQPK